MHRAAALLVLLAACGPSAEVQAPAPAAESAPAGVSADQLRQLLSASWITQAQADPDGVAALLDAPGGDGWIALFHGDLDGAARAFGPEPTSDSAKLGLARVHLERAAAFAEAEALCRDAGLALFDWRDAHRDTVRSGAREPVLAAVLRGQEPPAGDDAPALRALLAGDPSQLPEPWRARRAYAAGDRSPEALAAAGSAAPDLVEPLGRDEEAGLDFELPFDDPSRLGALKRQELLAAARLAGQAGPAGHPLIEAAQLFWGGDPPTMTGASRTETTVPAWAGLFVAREPDVAAWKHRWSAGHSAASFADRVFEQAPRPAGTSSADADAVLRLAADLQPVLVEALGADGLAAELQLPKVLVDGLLRDAMADFADAPAQARRLGERSLDPTPGSLGGAADAGKTRVSHRNDRAFLLQLARVYWAGGQPDDAVSLVHPLTKGLPPLAAAERPLAQLAATATVGKRGETNQL